MGSLHDDAVVVDCHNDLILTVAMRKPFGEDHFGDYWIPQLRRGGVDVQVVPVFIEDEYRPEGALRRMLVLIDLLHREVQAHGDDVALCRNGAEIDAALSAGKIAFVLALEGCDGIGREVELFSVMHSLGVRVASLTHFGRNALADGSADETGGGLSPIGVAAVAEMQRLGILVDVSHLSDAGTRHVLDIASGPVIASHSSARVLCDHHRNLTDDLIRGIADSGGVIGINFFAGFIDPKEPTIDRIVDHIAHVSEVAGIDHVGLGPDFIKEYADMKYPGDVEMEGVKLGQTIERLESVGRLPALTERLLTRGFADNDVRKVLGDNFLRLFRECFRT